MKFFNAYVIISALFLVGGHQPALADKVIIASYIMLVMWIAFITTIASARGVNFHFGISSFIQLVIPTGLTILYFLNGFNLIFFPNMRLF